MRPTIPPFDGDGRRRETRDHQSCSPWTMARCQMTRTRTFLPVCAIPPIARHDQRPIGRAGPPDQDQCNRAGETGSTSVTKFFINR